VLFRSISFYSDGLRLDGVLHLPSVSNPPVVVGSHGLASDGDSPKQIELANTCASLGMAYFRFHHRGCGTSEGFFPDVTTLENRKKDLLAAVTTVMSRPDTGDRLALFGSSMGGTTCIAASDHLNVEGYVLVAAPVVGKSLTKPPENLNDNPELGPDFYERLLNFDMTDKIPRIKNILVFHGDNDETVPMKNSETLYRLAGEPKKLIIQPNGDHRISDPGHQIEFIRESSEWFRRCFGL
jgi:dipeptidyl aminopeptidase/acylaminoacyl peptidase